jgi:DNA-binding MarR family transcriptional regulator
MKSKLTLEDRIIVAIRRISQAVENYSRFLWQQHGLTAPQLGALRELERNTQLTPGGLAESLHVSPQTVAGIVQRLERRGLVTKTRDEDDRRSFEVRITPEGQRLAAEAPSLLRDRFSAKLNELEVWERTQILATLQRVASMMSAEELAEIPFLYHEKAKQEESEQSP